MGRGRSNFGGQDFLVARDQAGGLREDVARARERAANGENVEGLIEAETVLSYWEVDPGNVSPDEIQGARDALNGQLVGA